MRVAAKSVTTNPTHKDTNAYVGLISKFPATTLRHFVNKHAVVCEHTQLPVARDLHVGWRFHFVLCLRLHSTPLLVFRKHLDAMVAFITHDAIACLIHRDTSNAREIALPATHRTVVSEILAKNIIYLQDNYHMVNESF